MRSSKSDLETYQNCSHLTKPAVLLAAGFAFAVFAAKGETDFFDQHPIAFTFLRKCKLPYMELSLPCAA